MKPVKSHKNAIFDLATSSYNLNDLSSPKENVDLDNDPVVLGPLRATPYGNFSPTNTC